MNTRDVPRALRGSLPESLAYEAGCEAGSRGLGADVNPWLGKGPEYGIAFTETADTLHALALLSRRTLCGERAFDTFPSDAFGSEVKPCRRCMRSVEAERRRLAQSWERGRLSAHPK